MSDRQTFCPKATFSPSEMMVMPIPRTQTEPLKLVDFKPTEADCVRYIHFRYADRCWVSTDGQFEVALNIIQGYHHLKIHHRQDLKIDDWYTFQQIKNAALGENVSAVQVFPRQSDLVDGSNTYHLWTWFSIDQVIPNLKEIPRYH